MATILTQGLVWYLTLLGIGVVSFPLFRVLLSVERAWILSRLLGPYLLTTLLFLPRLWKAPIQLETSALFSALAALLACAAAVALARMNRIGLTFSPRATWVRLLQGEALALGLFIASAVFCAYVASVDGPSERLMNTAFWVALHVQKTFPLEDPWLSGFSLRYYTLGYYPLALPGLILKMDPLQSYHFALCGSFALYGLALFGVLWAAGLSTGKAVAGSLALALGGNLMAALQAAKHLLLHLPYDWRAPIVAVRDGITEFPLWSLSQTNLHPHFISNFLLVALVLVIGEKTAALFLAFLFLWIRGAHPWEIPIFAGVVLIHFLFQERRQKVWALAGAVALFLILSIPFSSGAESFPVRLGWVSRVSTLEELLKAFGLFLFPLWVLLLYRKSSRWLLVGVLIAAGAANLGILALLGTLLLLWGLRREKWFLPALGGLGVLLVCEVFYVNDPVNPGTRIATIHKWYPCAWTLLGIAAVQVVLTLPRKWLAPGLSVWVLVLSSYFLLGLPARARHFQTQNSYDGLVASRQTPQDDLRLIGWMRGRVKEGNLKGVLLEPLGSPYGTGARYSSLTGLRSFMACPDCPHLLQFHSNDSTVSRRIRLSTDLFQNPHTRYAGCGELKKELVEASISWIVWTSQLSRPGTNGEAVEFLAGCLPQVHREGNALLMAVR